MVCAKSSYTLSISARSTPGLLILSLAAVVRASVQDAFITDAVKSKGLGGGSNENISSMWNPSIIVTNSKTVLLISQVHVSSQRREHHSICNIYSVSMHCALSSYTADSREHS